MTGQVLLWGAGAGLLLVGYGFFFRKAGLGFRHPAGYVFYLIVILAALAPIWSESRTAADTGFGDGLLIGTLAGAIGSFIYALYVYWYNARVDDGLLVEVREYAMERRRRKGQDDESGDRRVERLTRPGPFAQSIFLSLGSTALLAGAVGALWLL